MGLTSNKIRRLWLPSLLILLVILTLSLLLSSLIYPDNIQGNSPVPTTPLAPTASPTSTLALAATATKSSDPGDAQTQVPTSEVNCTYTTTYWRDNPQAWLIENVVIGNNSFTKVEAIAILEVEAQDEESALYQQFFAALLNTLKGAESNEIESTLIEASEWINGHPAGVAISEADRQQALLFAQTLLEYNIGGLGPGHCADEPVTPTPTPTATATATLTPTVTPIRTLRTPTEIPRDRKPTATEAGQTEQPTEEPTGQPQPTNTPEPQPTNTPRPIPTQAPTEAPPTEPPPTEAPPPTP
jgi:hypothetical protein